ncbi:MAG: hypothetical protein LRY55_03610 [Leadbetterella sp.]|nr:hypothetical protein [Leadbetterella sp.]
MKKTRLHSPLLQGIEEALERIFGQGKKSDQVVPAVLKAHPKWGSRDRSFVAENTYEIVRNKRLILHCLADHSSGEGVLKRMIGAWLILKGDRDDSDFFRELDPETIRMRASVTDPRIRFSMPDILNDYIVSELGEERWYKELEAMSSPADVYLRVNLNSISREKLQEILRGREIETALVEDGPRGIEIIEEN